MPGQRYRCTNRCGFTRVVPESPTDGQQTIRAGCEHCEDRTRFVAIGSVVGQGRTARRHGL